MSDSALDGILAQLESVRAQVAALAPSSGAMQDECAVPDNSIAELGGASRRKPTMRAYGPYRNELKTTVRWRVVVRRKNEKDEVRYFSDEKAAKAEVRKVNREAAEMAAPTVDEVIEEYRTY